MQNIIINIYHQRIHCNNYSIVLSTLRNVYEESDLDARADHIRDVTTDCLQTVCTRV